MFDRLAALADRSGKRIVVLALVFFAVAGALGAGVADRLDPYGADDPETESVIADERLEAAGYRDTSLVVLIDSIDLESAAGQRRVEELTTKIERDRDVQEVASFLSTDSRAFVSRDGDSTYLAVSLKPTDDDDDPGRRRPPGRGARATNRE